MSIGDCKIIEFPKITDSRGNLSFIEGNRHVLFDIKRIYYLYDVPGRYSRHAHKMLEQVIIAISGSFDIVLDDGFSKERFHLNRSYYGLYISSMVWGEIDNFSSGSRLSGTRLNFLYDEADYYRNYSDFLSVARGR